MSNKNFLFISLVLFLSACASPKLAYKIDPEIKNIGQLTQQSALIAVTVVDERGGFKQNNGDNNQIIEGPKNEAEIIKNKLIEALKKNNFKIISNPLLADLSLELTIKQFDIRIQDSFLQANIIGTSQLLVRMNKQDENFEKLYKNSHSQKVAKPVSSLDLTGVVNHLLSEQLTAMMSDPKLKDNINNNQMSY